MGRDPKSASSCLYYYECTHMYARHKPTIPDIYARVRYDVPIEPVEWHEFVSCWALVSPVVSAK